MAKTSKIGVFVVEDHPVMLRGLEDLLTAEGFNILGRAQSGREAKFALRKLKPEVLVFDLTLPDGDGIGWLEDMVSRGMNSSVLVYTMHDETEFVEKAFAKGVFGYVIKGDPAEELIQGVYAVAEGKVFLSRSVSRKVAYDAITSNLPSQGRPFSRREKEIFTLLGKGFRPVEISEKLFLSPKTVETYMLRLKKKLHIVTNRELIRVAIERFK